MDYNDHSAWWLIGRTLMPSASSLICSGVVVMGLVGFHLLLLSNQADLFLPYVAGSAGSTDQLAAVYNQTILAPLNNLFGNSLLGGISTALVWGAIGWVVYALLDFAITSFAEWRLSDKEISTPFRGSVVRHPLHNQVIIRVLWRFLLGVVAIGSFIGFQPIISNLFSHDVSFLRADSPLEMLKHLSIGLVGWLAIMHFYVVLFRFFAFRTRVFGEILY